MTAKTTPEQAKKLAEKYGTTGPQLAHFYFGSLAALIDEVQAQAIAEQGEYLNHAELQRGSNRYEALRKLTAKQFTELNRRNLAGENFDGMVDALVAGEPLAKQQESAPVLPKLPAEIQHAKENYFVFSPERAGELMREYALAAIAALGVAK
jgi:hypothetical protein